MAIEYIDKGKTTQLDMDDGRKVLLIVPANSTFIKRDEGILNRHCRVKKYVFGSTKKPILLFWELLKLLFVSIWIIPKSDIVYCWFSGYHTFFPSMMGSLFGKRVIVVVAGYDAVSIPSIKFGVFWKKNMMTLFAKGTYRYSDYILTVDKSLEKGVNYYADPDGKGYPIGVKSFLPNVKAEFHTIPFGFNTDKWRPEPNVTRQPAVLSVGLASSTQVFKRKGFDLLIDVAKLLPNTKFCIVGLSDEMIEYAKTTAGRNVELEGSISVDKLRHYFSSFKVFAQLSMSEGQPNTLCEAMACGCIPVGSDVNGIPTSIGECGFVLKKRDAKIAAQLIQQALDAPVELAERVRQRIIDEYPMGKREQALLPFIT